jgi:hypothetical protein
MQEGKWHHKHSPSRLWLAVLSFRSFFYNSRPLIQWIIQFPLKMQNNLYCLGGKLNSISFIHQDYCPSRAWQIRNVYWCALLRHAFTHKLNSPCNLWGSDYVTTKFGENPFKHERKLNNARPRTRVRGAWTWKVRSLCHLWWVVVCSQQIWRESVKK